MIEFQVVRWRNFLNCGNYFIEIKLNEAQNTLIIGKNGAGKSTVLDALCFALFGKPFRKINKPTVVNSINKKDCLVELEFRIDQTQYKIVRGLAPKIFELYINGEKKKQDTSDDDDQEFLEKFILKFNMKSFTQIVVLGSATYTPFMDLSAQDRRLIIEDLLDIQVFSTMSNLVKSRLKENKEAISKNKLLIQAGQQKKEMQESYIAELKKDRDAMIHEHQEEIDHNIDQIQELRDSVKRIDQEIERLNLKIVDKAKINDQLKELTKLEIKLEQKLDKHEDHLKFFESNTTCPTCTQEIADKFRQEKISRLSEEKEKYSTGLGQLTAQLTKLSLKVEDIRRIEKDIQTHQTIRMSKTTTIESLESSNLKLETKIKEVKARSTVTSKDEEKLQEILNEINAAETQKMCLFEDKLYLDTAATLLTDSGIKAKIIKQYIPIINSACNKHLASLDFFVNFNLDENFEETIKSRHRDDFTYHSFSEGQKNRISMSLVLTWRTVAKLKNSVDTNILFLDEIFDSSMDSDGTEELMKMLHLLKENNVFVISHRGDILRDKFTRTIKFIEKQNFSYIEE